VTLSLLKHFIAILPELRDKIIEDRERLRNSRADHGHAVTSIQDEIKSLESTQATLEQRVATLSVQVLLNESAAQELSNVECRASAIRARLEQLRAKPMPSIDLAPTYECLYSICYAYERGVKDAFMSDVAPWGIDESLARRIIGDVPAFAALVNLRNWLSLAPSATHSNLSRFDAVYARALRGEIDLSRDTITEADAPSDEAETTAQPTTNT
jgi:hypothetical protein